MRWDWILFMLSRGKCPLHTPIWRWIFSHDAILSLHPKQMFDTLHSPLSNEEYFHMMWSHPSVQNIVGNFRHTTSSSMGWGIFSHDAIPSLHPKQNWQSLIYYILLRWMRNLVTWCNPTAPSKIELTVLDTLHRPPLDDESFHMIQSHSSVQKQFLTHYILLHKAMNLFTWCNSIPPSKPKLEVSNTPIFSLDEIPSLQESFQNRGRIPSF
jgi:hypothetical protein